MWVEQTPNGKYKYRERFADPMTGKSRIVSVTMEKNTKQSEKIARELLRQKMQIRPEYMTLSGLIELYNAEQRQTVKLSTATRNQGVLERCLQVLGDVRLDKLTAGYIRKCFSDSGKSHTTLNEYIVRLKALLRWGYKYDYVQDIRFLDKLDKFPDTPHAEKIQDKFLEKEELEALIGSIVDPVWKDLTMFLALSGLRFGEAAALLRSDVDVGSRTITVDKTYDPVNDVVTAPKTFHSIRTVYMQDELLRLSEEILAAGRILSMSNLFFTKNGLRIDYNAFREYLRRQSVKVLGRAVSPHVLRHTHASLLMEAGVDIDTISARLGHSNSQITKAIYLHVTERLRDSRNERLRSVKLIDVCSLSAP